MKTFLRQLLLGAMVGAASAGLRGRSLVATPAPPPAIGDFSNADTGGMNPPDVSGLLDHDFAGVGGGPTEDTGGPTESPDLITARPGPAGDASAGQVDPHANDDPDAVISGGRPYAGGADPAAADTDGTSPTGGGAAATDDGPGPTPTEDAPSFGADGQGAPDVSGGPARPDADADPVLSSTTAPKGGTTHKGGVTRPSSSGKNTNTADLPPAEVDPNIGDETAPLDPTDHEQDPGFHA